VASDTIQRDANFKRQTLEELHQYCTKQWAIEQGLLTEPDHKGCRQLTAKGEAYAAKVEELGSITIGSEECAACEKKWKLGFN
jgi:hypothetical protein